MSSGWSPRVEIDGGEATAEQLGVPALVNYGHFTAMQVRKGAVRGLELHMRRLRTATRELFGVDLDADRVRDHLRHALGHGVGDASARITVFQPEPGSGVSVLVALRPAVGMPAMPQAPQAVPYQRPLPHIKHVGTFGQIHYGRLAERHGFDDALLTGADGIVAEAAISNIGSSTTPGWSGRTPRRCSASPCSCSTGGWPAAAYGPVGRQCGSPTCRPTPALSSPTPAASPRSAGSTTWHCRSAVGC